MIVLARILTPTDFGIYALCYSVFLFFQSFLDFGLTPIYLKYPKVDTTINSSFLSINLFFGSSVALILMIIAPVMVFYYDIHDLYLLFGILALSAISMSSSNQPYSQLLRQKQFYQTQSISVGSNVVALGLSILLASLGYGPIALAIKHLSYSVTRLISAMICARAKYQLVSKQDLSKIKPYVLQAYHLTISRLITGISGNIEKLAVGKIFGEATLGHYERGLFVVEKPNAFRNAITTPAMTYLSSMPQNRLSKAYIVLNLLILNFIGIPCLICFLYGSELTLWILGDQWFEAGGYVTWLAFLGLALIFKGLTNIMYINDLKTKELTKLYWVGITIVYLPVLGGFLYYNIDMTTFVMLYSVVSFLYWFVIWCLTILRYTQPKLIAMSCIGYIITLYVGFISTSYLLMPLMEVLEVNPTLWVLSLLTLSYLVSVGLVSLIFTHRVKEQIEFIKNRI